MTIILYIFVAVILIFMFADPKATNGGASNQSAEFYSAYNEQGLALIRDLEKHYFSNTCPENLHSPEYLQSFGIISEEGEVSTLNNLFKKIGLENYDQLPENSNGYLAGQHLFDLYVLTLTGRHSAATSESYDVTPSEIVEEDYGINLFEDEVLVKVFSKMCWKEEKTRTVGVTYSGVRMQGKGAFKAVFGSMAVNPHTTTSYEVVDYGDLYLTNKRVIFVGDKNKNRSIRLNRIVNTSLFEDGVLLGKENGTSPLVCWPDWERLPEYTRWSQWSRREAGEFIVTLNRVMFDDVVLTPKENANTKIRIVEVA
jgi:hypothetical protein